MFTEALVVTWTSMCAAMVRLLCGSAETTPTDAAKVKSFPTLSTFSQLLFSNTLVSMLHSALSSLLAISALLTSHSLNGDYVNTVTSGEFLATSVSTGYFAYDLWDYVLNGLYVKSPGIILHHVVVLICYISALTKTAGVPLLSLALACELQSVLMHARKLLTMSNYSVQQSPLLRWVWRAQWTRLGAKRRETGNAQAGAMTMKGAKTDAEWFSPVELAAAREEYLQEQEKEQPSPQVKLRYAIALAKSRKRDDKYRAIGLLEEYRASRSYCERLLRMEPSHMKAQLLHKRIKEVVAKEDGVVGVGIVGAVVVAGLALKFLLKR
ncbi:Fis1, C-terminal tetratricopeptide repeat [Phytophthora cactorum]|nr:Fis1, C-terminal tetratricopeptide repeat [Phytophthora cactorum]